MLKSFWFSTDTGLGYGVTAETRLVAEEMLEKFGYPHAGQTITGVKEISSATELEQNHVVPNCGPLVVRGVWFPKHNV
jgi:hypothetical protein